MRLVKHQTSLVIMKLNILKIYRMLKDYYWLWLMPIWGSIRHLTAHVCTVVASTCSDSEWCNRSQLKLFSVWFCTSCSCATRTIRLRWWIYVSSLLNFCLWPYNWRASGASQTLSGVTQLKIGDVCLFIYMFGRTYVILYFDPRIFLCSLRVRPRPKLH